MTAEIKLRRTRGWPQYISLPAMPLGRAQNGHAERALGTLRQRECRVNRALAVPTLDAAFSCCGRTCEELHKAQGQLKALGGRGGVRFRSA
jgi:hypothetical protein